MGMSSVIKRRGWANLPAEQLRDVIKRLEESESKWPARKYVVVCAGVCKRWRVMCKNIVKNPEFSSKLTFSVSLKQPGPRDGSIKCFIKREWDKSNMIYNLYLSLTPHDSECLKNTTLVGNGKFLLSAKCKLRNTYIEYAISMDSDNILRPRTTYYIGKMRCNLLGTKFILYDMESQANRILSRWFENKKVSFKEVTSSERSYNNAQVTYDLNLVGPCGPLRLQCIFHSIPASAIEEPGPQEEEEGKKGPLVLKNKPPRWHKKLKCWCLGFKERVRVAPVKNFQLMEVQSDGDEKRILQFGKVDKDVFTMDYRYPLSAFQAFAICLTSF